MSSGFPQTKAKGTGLIERFLVGSEAVFCGRTGRMPEPLLSWLPDEPSSPGFVEGCRGGTRRDVTWRLDAPAPGASRRHRTCGRRRGQYNSTSMDGVARPDPPAPRWSSAIRRVCARSRPMLLTMTAHLLVEIARGGSLDHRCCCRLRARQFPRNCSRLSMAVK